MIFSLASGGSLFKIKVKRAGRVKKPRLDEGPLTAIGNKMVEAQLDRWSKAVNADGAKAKPLSVKYAIIKQKTLHKKAVRDMRMTGLTAANFKLRKAIDNTIRAENTTRQARQNAQKANDIEQMIGLAGSDQQAIFRQSQAEYGKWLEKAWIPVTGNQL